MNRYVPDLKRALKRSAQTQRGGARPRLVAWLVRHRELVATEACEQIIMAQQRAQARPDLPQNLIARVVTERVIELFEPIQIDQQQRQPHATALRLGDLRVQAVQEMPAVAKAGQRVGDRLVLALAQPLPNSCRGARHPYQDRACRQAHRQRTDPHELPDREQPERNEHKPKDRAQHNPAKRRPRFAARLAPPHRRYQQRDGHDHHTRAKQRQPGRANQQPPTRPPPAQRQRASNPRRSDNHRSARPERRSQRTGRAPAHPGIKP